MLFNITQDVAVYLSNLYYIRGVPLILWGGGGEIVEKNASPQLRWQERTHPYFLKIATFY